jgi:hypothetical protein
MDGGAAYPGRETEAVHCLLKEPRLVLYPRQVSSCPAVSDLQRLEGSDATQLFPLCLSQPQQELVMSYTYAMPFVSTARPASVARHSAHTHAVAGVG